MMTILSSVVVTDSCRGDALPPPAPQSADGLQEFGVFALIVAGILWTSKPPPLPTQRPNQTRPLCTA